MTQAAIPENVVLPAVVWEKVRLSESIVEREGQSRWQRSTRLHQWSREEEVQQEQSMAESVLCFFVWCEPGRA
ncbi:hypothetical protein KSB_84510 [Ktedonobacter robiniae]|uniref:Uncharacterized protein n=1 Tax=Ktedonobacter robiniae TaxID=2778365 RepID=A0ABQ3V473_9CHLR|nr:hypothetical protein KSB_84510 [Ktedonobacter robiniae]